MKFKRRTNDEPIRILCVYRTNASKRNSLKKNNTKSQTEQLLNTRRQDARKVEAAPENETTIEAFQIYLGRHVGDKAFI